MRFVWWFILSSFSSGHFFRGLRCVVRERERYKNSKTLCRWKTILGACLVCVQFISRSSSLALSGPAIKSGILCLKRARGRPQQLLWHKHTPGYSQPITNYHLPRLFELCYFTTSSLSKHKEMTVNKIKIDSRFFIWFWCPKKNFFIFAGWDEPGTGEQ